MKNPRYTYQVEELLKNADKKSKVLGIVFSSIITLFCFIPFVLILFNYFELLVGVKSMLITGILISGVLIHIAISLFTSLYYVFVDTLVSEEYSVSFKKLFVEALLDYVVFGIIMVCAVIFYIVINYFI